MSLSWNVRGDRSSVTLGGRSGSGGLAAPLSIFALLAYCQMYCLSCLGTEFSLGCVELPQSAPRDFFEKIEHEFEVRGLAVIRIRYFSVQALAGEFQKKPCSSACAFGRKLLQSREVGGIHREQPIEACKVRALDLTRP